MPRLMGALTFLVSPELWARAVASKSGSCVIAQAVAEQYPFLVKVNVNVVSIRATDSRTGIRYTWLTPHAAGMLLLAFDQGWGQPETRKIVTRRPVHVGEPITSRPRSAAKAARIAELEAIENPTRADRASLTMLRKSPTRSHKTGRSSMVAHPGDERTKVGGQPPRTGATKTGSHPNFLAGRDRHFGARLAKAGIVWDNAIDHEIARRREAGEL